MLTKNEVVLMNIEAQMKEIFEKGLSEATIKRFDALQGMMNGTKDVAKVSFHVHQPELYVNLGKIKREDIPEDMQDFFSKCESNTKIVGFRDEFKKLTAIGGRTKAYLQTHATSLGAGQGWLMTKDDFRDFFSYYNERVEEWNEVVESIKTQYDSVVADFKKNVDYAIRNVYAKGESEEKIASRNQMLSELRYATSKSKEVFCRKLELELHTDFKESAFDVEETELRDFVRESAKKEQQAIIQNLMSVLLSQAFSDCCLFLKAVSRTTGDDICGLRGSYTKFRKATSTLDKMNIYEFAVISRIVLFERRIALLTDKYDCMYALIDLLKWIFQRADPFGITLDTSQLPQTDCLSLSPDMLEEDVEDDFLDIYGV